MVQRQSQPFELVGGRAPEVQQTRVGFASADPNRFAVAPVTANTERSDVLNGVLGALAKGSEALANQYIRRSLEENYLEGVAAAGRGEVEEALEGNPLTKDWKIAGFRDTNAKLKAAEQDSRLAFDMKKLREQDPEKFQEYLRAKRAELLPLMEGMSFEQRKGMLGHRIMWERQAVAQHGVEYANYIMERKQLGTQASSRQAVQAMNEIIAKSGNNPSAAATYDAAVDTFMANLNMNVVMDPTWTTAKKGELLYEAARFALQPGNSQVRVYERMMNTEVTLPDGSKVGMIDLIPADKQEKLAIDYKQAKGHIQGQRLAQLYDEEAAMEARLNNWSVLGAVSKDEVDALIVRRREFDPSYTGKELLGKYYDSYMKYGRVSAAVTAVERGDRETLARLGVSEQEAIEAKVKQMRRDNQSPDAILQTLVNLGTQTGSTAALKMAGSEIAPAVASMGIDGVQHDPAEILKLHTVLTNIGEQKLQGRGDLLGIMMQGMPEETRGKIEKYLYEVRRNATPEQAWRTAQEHQLRMAEMPAAQRNAIAGINAKDEKEAVQRFGTQGVLSLLLDTGMAALPWSGTTVQQTWNTSKANSWAPSAYIAGGYEDTLTATMRGEFSTELSRIRRNDPYLPLDAAERMARASLAERMVPTKWGPIFLPQGADAKRIFGIDSNVGADRIGEAISDMYAPPQGGRMVWRVGPSGKAVATVFDSDGRKMGNELEVDPSLLRAKLTQMDQDAAQRAQDLVGGKLVKGKSGISVTINGRNTSGQELGWVARWREQLVKHEDVRDQIYDDATGKPLQPGEQAKGKPTVSVGVMFQNPAFPQGVKPGTKLTQEQIDQSFRRASDEAISIAVKHIPGPLRDNEKAFQLYASMAYHGGRGTFSRKEVRAMSESILRNDPETAVSDLQNTPHWKVAGAERKKYYEKLVRELASYKTARTPIN